MEIARKCAFIAIVFMTAAGCNSVVIDGGGSVGAMEMLLLSN